MENSGKNLKNQLASQQNLIEELEKEISRLTNQALIKIIQLKEVKNNLANIAINKNDMETTTKFIDNLIEKEEYSKDTKKLQSLLEMKKLYHKIICLEKIDENELITNMDKAVIDFLKDEQNDSILLDIQNSQVQEEERTSDANEEEPKNKSQKQSTLEINEEEPNENNDKKGETKQEKNNKKQEKNEDKKKSDEGKGNKSSSFLEKKRKK